MKPSESAIWRGYEAATSGSRAQYDRARQYIPLGTSRSTISVQPYPIYAAAAQGCRLTDLDGTTRIDCNNNMTALALGHAHPAVIAAVAEQLPKGTAYAAPTELETALAAELCGRVPSLDKLLFVNSGTEAVMGAVRVARAHTGRAKIAKMEGGYHGFSDALMISGKSVPAGNDPDLPRAQPDLDGIPRGVVDDTVVIRYNSITSAERVIAEHGHAMAAVLIEPVLGSGGMIPADPDFLAALRVLTRKAGILLICDEVITLRCAPGGGQDLYGLAPDLTTMAKIIGGGFPVGAYGGSDAVMGSFAAPGPGRHMANLGTFAANPVTLAAGLATMREFDAAAIARLNALGHSLRAALQAVARRHGLGVQVTGLGSLFQIHFTPAAVRDFRAAQSADAVLQRLAQLAMANHGVLLAPRCMGCLSTPMDDAEVDAVAAAFDATCGDLAAEGWVG
jgi:glutamate-1-semialdehyde 2,1-aminomutase